jgi:hypothetical protein
MSMFPTLLLAPAWVQGQPTPAPASGDALCEDPPPEPAAPDVSQPDAAGFHSLFNGVDFNGWWLNCGTAHSRGKGPLFRVDPEKNALYSNAREELDGGALMTRAKFMDYELLFDYWPDWGNDAGLLHRADVTGAAYLTTLGYMENTSLGGTWGELGFGHRDYRPFRFASAESTITVPGIANGDEGSGWTALTRTLKAAGEAFDCPETGCTQADWRRLWNADGWNQIRVVFHGGSTAGSRIHARAWFRKPGASTWVPLGVDSGLVRTVPAGYIGLRVHGGGRYSGSRGTWYRNIRWRPWPYISIYDPWPWPIKVAGPTPARHPPAIRVDATRQAIHITFAEMASRREVRVLALDGKSVAVRRNAEREVFLSAAGWKSGVYVLRMEENGRLDRSRILLP